MGIIAPLFLLGSLAIALPIWLHRLQTKSSNRQPFSSAMLLETTEQQIHVQKKLKYLLLLALRIALLLLIAIAFAKPFLERPPNPIAETGSGSQIIVLDTSVSMGRSGVFEQAREQARRALDEAPAGTTIQLVAADGVLRLVRPPSTDRASQRAAINGVAPGTERLDVGRLMGEIGRYAQSLPRPISLHLVSDFQASAMPARFASAIPDGIAQFLPHVVGTGDPVNWSIARVVQTSSGVDVAVRSQGMPDRTADVELRINGVVAGRQTASGQGQHLLSFDGLTYAAGDNRIVVTLLTDDDLDTDNRWYAVVRNEPPLPVPLLTRNPDGLPVTYLSAALEASADADFDVQPLVIGDFDPRVLSRYSWAIIDDIGAVDATLAPELRGFLERGGNLLAFAGDRALAADTLPLSSHRLAPARLDAGRDAFQSVGRIDTQHPALSGTEGWHRVTVSRSVAIELDGAEEVPMRLENGDPFIVEQARGAGRLLLVLSAADNRWNDLPVHPVFVGFMLETADYLSGRIAAAVDYTVGSRLPLSSASGAVAGQVIDPDGDSLLALADTARAQAIRLEKPGFYEVYTAEGQSLVAANIDPLESDLAPVSQALLERWRDATYSRDEGVDQGSGGDPSAARATLALWPWLLLLLAVVAIAESALGNVHIAMKTRASQ